MSDTIMTIIGNVVATPTLRKTKKGVLVTNLRVASTPRHLNRETGEWGDGKTLFVNVTCWRGLGENVAASLKKGDPVVVTGKLGQTEYEKNEVLRVSYELAATAVGPDLSRGTATFTRTPFASQLPAVSVDEDGNPVDDSEFYLDLADDGSTMVDVQTGEVRELAAAG